eukprot:g33853.t1
MSYHNLDETGNYGGQMAGYGDQKLTPAPQPQIQNGLPRAQPVYSQSSSSLSSPSVAQGTPQPYQQPVASPLYPQAEQPHWEQQQGAQRPVQGVPIARPIAQQGVPIGQPVARQGAIVQGQVLSGQVMHSKPYSADTVAEATVVQQPQAQQGGAGCGRCGAYYALPVGATSWRCKTCHYFNDVSGSECIIS